MSTTNSLTYYIASFVDELVRVGIDEVVISPGSRSTPIALLMAEHPGMKTYVNIDERSAAFFALGIAKAKRRPVAILCTSGTAAANYYPAIIEARYSRVPLLIITADRPHELRDVGAPQAIDQNQIYGQNVKWFVEMALPEATKKMLRYVRTVAGRAAGTATSAPAGPVHLNFPFREPLVPNLDLPDLWTRPNEQNDMHIDVIIGKAVLREYEVKSIIEKIQGVKKGIIICGPHDDPEFTEKVIKLAEKLRFPILADPLSQLRSGKHQKKMVIDQYDSILRNDIFCEKYKPEIIIRFGAMPVSKALLQYIEKSEGVSQIVIDEAGSWREPTLSATEMIYCNETHFCEVVMAHLDEINHNQWLDIWLSVNAKVKHIVQEIKDEEFLFEGKIFQELSCVMPMKSTLFVGNSMPIRDLDTFFFNNEKEIRVIGNRGANGIDGIVSSALGVSTKSSTILVIGDLSFYHDLNGLLAAKQNDLQLTIILINNDGGGIFSFLPQSKIEKHFEDLFGTPIGLNFELAVHMYGGEFVSIENWSQFRESIKDSVAAEGLTVIEMRTNRKHNVIAHRNLWNRVSQEINNLLGIRNELHERS